jgi:hypothetical protein
MDVHIARRKAEARTMLASGADGGDWGDDVFSMLVRANELEKNPKLLLSDDELVSDDKSRFKGMNSSDGFYIILHRLAIFS